MKSAIFKQWAIKDIRQHLLCRRFAVPRLQRNFVWDARRAAKLLDSIYRRIPVGSLFLWEMERSKAHLIRQSAELLPSFSNKNPHIWFVIDGQQRLSVISQAFEAQVRCNDFGRSIDFGRLCFLVNPPKEGETPERIVYRKPQDGKIIPVKDIVAADWKKRFAGRPKNLINKVADCRDRLLNYRLPIVIVESATLDEIGDVFIRVNSQGMKITSVDKAVALMGTLDIRDMAQELRQKVRDDVFELPSIDPILRGLNLIIEPPTPGKEPTKLDTMAKKLSRQIETDSNAKKDFQTTWHKYQIAFLSSVAYLHHRFPVYDKSFLPSENMLATLAVFFYHNNAQPNGPQAREIKKWFWATGFGERYSGRGYHQNIAKDALFFEGLANGKRKTFTLGQHELLDPVLDIQGKEYSTGSARARAFLCLLATRKPRYLDTGLEIPLAQAPVVESNSKHRHHIFPKAHLSRHFSIKDRNSLCNICFLVAKDNREISFRRPAALSVRFSSP